MVVKNYLRSPHNISCNAGIYALSPNVIKRVPKNSFYNMTDLIENVSTELASHSFSIHEYWADIGTLEDLAKARSEF